MDFDFRVHAGAQQISLVGNAYQHGKHGHVLLFHSLRLDLEHLAAERLVGIRVYGDRDIESGVDLADLRFIHQRADLHGVEIRHPQEYRAAADLSGGRGDNGANLHGALQDDAGCRRPDLCILERDLCVFVRTSRAHELGVGVGALQAGVFPFLFGDGLGRVERLRPAQLRLRIGQLRPSDTQFCFGLHHGVTGNPRVDRDQEVATADDIAGLHSHVHDFSGRL